MKIERQREQNDKRTKESCDHKTNDYKSTNKDMNFFLFFTFLSIFFS